MSIHPDPTKPLTMSFLSHVHRINSCKIANLFTINISPDKIQQTSLDITINCCTEDITNLYLSLNKYKRLHLKLHDEILLAKIDISCVKVVTHFIHVMLSELQMNCEGALKSVKTGGTYAS